MADKENEIVVKYPSTDTYNTTLDFSKNHVYDEHIQSSIINFLLGPGVKVPGAWSLYRIVPDSSGINFPVGFDTYNTSTNFISGNTYDVYIICITDTKFVVNIKEVFTL